MKKCYKNFIKTFVLSFIFILSLIKVNASAEVIELSGEPEGLIITQKNLFDIKNMNPGDKENSKITIKNTANNKIKLYLTIKKTSSVDLEGDLFEKLQITVNYKNGQLFSGNIGGFTPSNLYLGEFAKGDSKEIDINAYLPGAETDNRYQGKDIKMQWIFTATEVASPGGNLPKTGETATIMIYLLGIISILYGVRKLLARRSEVNS